MNARAWLAIWTAVLAATGCQEDPLVSRLDIAPIANAGGDQMVDFDGQAVAVTLDGSGSSDADGRIDIWRWMSLTTQPDAGSGIVVPEGESPSWPDDVEKPTIELPEGVWTLALWVIDDGGQVSSPATVKITVGTPPASADPEVAACIEQSYAELSEPCKLCTCAVSADCRAALPACGADCWALITCLGEMCPGFDAADPASLQCFSMNCGQFIAGATAATPAGPCAVACANECSS